MIRGNVLRGVRWLDWPCARIPAESPQSAERIPSGAQDAEEPRQTEFTRRASAFWAAPGG
jgi:hypothetical protein